MTSYQNACSKDALDESRMYHAGLDAALVAQSEPPEPFPIQNADARRKSSPEDGHGQRPEAGQSLVESTFVLLAFFVLLFGVIDCGQVLVAHQSLVERVRGAVRWGVVRPYDGTGEQIANLILYNQPEEPRAAEPGYLGLTRENVQVRYQPATPERPDDEMLSVAIVNYHYHFLSPWVGKAIVNPRPVLMSSPMALRSTANLSSAAPAPASRP